LRYRELISDSLGLDSFCRSRSPVPRARAILPVVQYLQRERFLADQKLYVALHSTFTIGKWYQACLPDATQWRDARIMLDAKRYVIAICLVNHRRERPDGELIALLINMRSGENPSSNRLHLSALDADNFFNLPYSWPPAQNWSAT
jgi:hypothetical protein